MSGPAHWEAIHAAKGSQVSWWQDRDDLWLDLIQDIPLDRSAPVVDIGAGSSMLLDVLLDAGFQDLIAVDISAAGLARIRERIGDRADFVVADAREFVSPRPIALWHDRAVFHFLTLAADRARYAECLHASLREDGWAIVATFAPDSPATCSGLPVTRWEAPDLAAELGLGLVRHHQRVHRTPWGTHQPFTIAVLQP